MNNSIFQLVLLLLFGASVAAQPIVIDEEFEDWSLDGVTSIRDVENDNIGSSYDFLEMGIASDDSYIYFNFEVNRLLNLQVNNHIKLYIDLDNDFDTGKKINGIGSDFEYYFGERRGKVFMNNDVFFVNHIDIGLMTLPTVSSKRFELLINRKTKLGGQFVFGGDSIKVLLVNDLTNGDKLPNTNGGLSCELNNTPLVLPHYQFRKQDDSEVRVLSYNVLRDDMFVPSKKESYEHLFQLIEPDIIGFEEIYGHSAKQTKDKVVEFLDDNSTQWYYEKSNPDIICLSKYPILDKKKLDGNAAFWIKKDGKDLVFIVAHLPCCDNNSGRQSEVDKIMAFVRDIREGNSDWDLEEHAAMIIVGDMNLVGDVQQRTTFLTGDIHGEIEFGSDFHPDWDNSDFEDTKAIASGLPAMITWYDEFSSYNPGRLDYIIYSGSVLQLDNSFSLFTPLLPQDTMAKYGLEFDDSTWASDHIPIVGDFKFVDFVATDNIAHKLLIDVHPNPSSDWISVDFGMDAINHAKVLIYNLDGEKIKSYKLGLKQRVWKVDVSKWTPGMYHILVQDEYQRTLSVEKFVVVRK